MQLCGAFDSRLGSMVSSSTAAATVTFALKTEAVLALAVVAVAIFSLHAPVAVFLPIAASVTVSSAVDVPALTLPVQRWSQW